MSAEEEKPDHLADAYRRASAEEAGRPGDVVRRAILDEAKAIHVLRTLDGKEEKLISEDQLRQSGGDPRFTVSNVTFVSQSNQLLAAGYSKKYGDNGYVFDLNTLKRIARFKCDGFLREITTVDCGRFIVTVSPVVGSRSAIVFVVHR